MTGFLDWIGGRRKRISSRAIDRIALAVELLEPRHLLAADGLGFVTGLGPNWHPDCAADWHAAVIQSVDHDAGPQTSGDRQAASERPELVILDELAEQLGDVFEIDNSEPWLYDGQWFDDELF